MSHIKNDRFLRALARQPVDCTPIWIMRQAGRYLPEYQAIRAKAGDFMTLCKTPELACEVTLQPLRRFDLDAAIVFSDILTIPDALGLDLHFIEGKGPQFSNPIRTVSDIHKLRILDSKGELGYVAEAIRLIRRELNGKVPLIGFSGSPWTLATYMIEGRSSRTFKVSKSFLFNEPQLMHQLLENLAENVTAYLNMQIEAGAQAIMLFDTWGGILSSHAYDAFSLGYMKKVIAGLVRQQEQDKIPVILFTKQGGQWLEKIVTTGCDAIGIDWTLDLNDARRRVGTQVAVQGNMDPAMLYASPEKIRQEVEIILNSYGHGSGHVFNLGHGITPDVNPDNVTVLVNAIHELSVPFHHTG